MSWPKVAIGDVVRIARTGVAPEDIRPGTPYVGLEHIDSLGNFVGIASVGAGELASSKFEFTRKHVLFGKLRPYLKKTARPDFEGICSTDILPLEPSRHLDRDYLFHVLRRQDFVDEVSSLCAGANLPRISPGVLVEMNIPLPPMEEQRRIAAILDKANALRAKRREASSMLDQLLQSVFIGMFGDPASNPMRWSKSMLGELSDIQTGSTPPTSSPEFFDGPIPFVTPGDLGGPVKSSRRTLSLDGVRRSRTVPAGSSLVCCIGATIGKAGFATMECAFNQQINAVIWNDCIDSIYGYYALRFLSAEIARKGSSTTLPIINKSDFERIEIAVPKIDSQKSFSKIAIFIHDQTDLFAKFNLRSEGFYQSLQNDFFASGR